MGINFPSAPTVGDLYPTPAVGGVPQYKWDGQAWVTAQASQQYVKLTGDTMTGPLTVNAPLQSDTFQFTRAADISNTNLNAINTTSWTNGSNVTNAPTAEWWFFETQRHTNNNGYLTQRATDLASDSGRVFMRHCINSVWGAWRGVAVIIQSDTVPPMAAANLQWFDTVGGQLYVALNGVWVAANSG